MGSIEPGSISVFVHTVDRAIQASFCLEVKRKGKVEITMHHLSKTKILESVNKG